MLISRKIYFTLRPSMNDCDEIFVTFRDADEALEILELLLKLIPNNPIHMDIKNDSTQVWIKIMGKEGKAEWRDNVSKYVYRTPDTLGMLYFIVNDNFTLEENKNYGKRAN
jgi:hypothetical protein